MWGACEKGIFRYNGYATRIFAPDSDSTYLVSQQVRVVYMDKYDLLWISYSDNNIVTRFNTVTNQAKHFLPGGGEKSLPLFPITGFEEDKKDNFWIMSWGGGIAKMNRQTGECQTYKPHTASTKLEEEIMNRVKDMEELPDGRFFILYFTNENSRFLPQIFDPKAGTFADFKIADYLNGVNPDVAAQIVRSIKIGHFIHIDKKGNLWLGTYMGLVHIDLKNKKAYRVSGQKNLAGFNLENTRGFVTDENDNLWVSTPNAGLMVVNKETRETRYLLHNTKTAASLSDNRLRHMRKDAEGNIWISTGQGGFSIYMPLVQQFKMIDWSSIDLGFSNRSEQPIPVNQMLVDSTGRIFLSSEKGIYVYDIDSGKVIRAIDPTEFNKDLRFKSKINDMRILGNGKLLITSSYKPAIYDLKKNAFTALKVPASMQREDFKLLFRHSHTAKDPLLAYTPWYNVLCQVDTVNAKVDSVFSVPLRDRAIDNVYSYVLASGKWLMGTNSGKDFVIYDPMNRSYNEYSYRSKEHFFPDSMIKMAYVANDNSIWFGTGSGLYHFDEKTGKSDYINPLIGLEKETVNSMMQTEDGVWWLALNKQLVRWNPKTGEVLRISKELGLKSGAFLPAVMQKDKQGRIFVATMNGAMFFDPSRIRAPRTVPKLELYMLSIGDDTLDQKRLDEFTTGNVSLKWNQNFLNFEFATNQVYSPVPHSFLYRLLGLDTNWQNNGASNRIRYTNLSSGTYTLQVKVKNSYGVSSDIHIIPFTIRAPFWLTWWFYTLLAMFIGVGFYSYVKYRERTFVKAQLVLEEKIKERTAEVMAKAEEIKLQKDVIFEKNKELTDSIYYAQRIQQSILPEDAQIRKLLQEHFIFFRPKDIVSGDFYWFSVQQDSVLWAVVDCTGHGVPGGFMSMMGSGLLNQIVNEELKLRPDEVLNHLRDRVIVALRQTGAIGENKDGMDLTLCRYIPLQNKLQMAGANNPLYIVRQGELMEIKPDKQPIGIYIDAGKPFSLREIQLEKNDMVYMSSDGYTDQFGGEKGKKFKTVNFEKLILSLAAKPVSEQGKEMEKVFDAWKGSYDQLDDVCVFGVRIV